MASHDFNSNPEFIGERIMEIDNNNYSQNRQNYPNYNQFQNNNNFEPMNMNFFNKANDIQGFNALGEYVGPNPNYNQNKQNGNRRNQNLNYNLGNGYNNNMNNQIYNQQYFQNQLFGNQRNQNRNNYNQYQNNDNLLDLQKLEGLKSFGENKQQKNEKHKTSKSNSLKHGKLENKSHEGINESQNEANQGLKNSQIDETRVINPGKNKHKNHVNKKQDLEVSNPPPQNETTEENLNVEHTKPKEMKKNSHKIFPEVNTNIQNPKTKNGDFFHFF